jgi:hypothetical protein
MSTEDECTQSLKTGVQISSEVFIPGGSNLIKGDFLQGGIHAGLGVVARVLFGIPGAVLVSANSISKAITGRHLHEHLSANAGKRTQDSLVKTVGTTKSGGQSLAAKKPKTKLTPRKRKVRGAD